jgi:hypothetical protein
MPGASYRAGDRALNDRALPVTTPASGGGAAPGGSQNAIQRNSGGSFAGTTYSTTSGLGSFEWDAAAAGGAGAIRLGDGWGDPCTIWWDGSFLNFDPTFGQTGFVVQINMTGLNFKANSTIQGARIVCPQYTVATLPSALGGTIVMVTDGAPALAWGATVTGGGSTKYLVWHNGTAWTVMGK